MIDDDVHQPALSRCSVCGCRGSSLYCSVILIFTYAEFIELQVCRRPLEEVAHALTAAHHVHRAKTKSAAAKAEDDDCALAKLDPPLDLKRAEAGLHAAIEHTYRPGDAN